MNTMLVVTCKKCGSHYNMDMEPHLDDVHPHRYTGEECEPGDNGWYIIEVPYRKDWRYAN